jgi:hypothetical protein
MKRPILILLICSIAFGAPAFFNPDGIQSPDEFRNLDWLSCRIFDANLYKSVHEFGQFPLWSPYLGGGYPVYQHPTDGSLTPFALPVLALGDIYGVKINLLILLFLGGLGVYLIARKHLELRESGALFSALAFMFSGWLPSMWLVGFYNQGMYFLIPLIVYFLLSAKTDLRQAIPAGLLYALFAYQGLWGIFSLGIFLGLLSLLLTINKKTGRFAFDYKPLVALALTGVVFLSLAGPRLLQVRELSGSGEYPHPAFEDYNQISSWEWFYQDAGHFLDAAFHHVPKIPINDPSGWPQTAEYPYLGIPWIALFLLIPAMFTLRRRFLPWGITGLIFLAWCFGPNLPVDLYQQTIWRIGTLRQITDPFKYFNFFLVLVIALGSGGAIEALYQKRFSILARKFGIVLSFLALIPFAAANGSLFGELFKLDRPDFQYEERFHQVRWKVDGKAPFAGVDYREALRPAALTAYYNIHRNIGTIDWYADIYLPENAKAKFLDSESGLIPNGEYRGEVWLEIPESGTVSDVRIKSNTIEATVLLNQPGVLTVNQNHHRGWRVDIGTLVNRDGLLAAEFNEPGEYSITFRFAPREFYYGLAFMLAALAFWSGLFFVAGKRADAPERCGTDTTV